MEKSNDVDLGTDADVGETVMFIITNYPEAKEGCHEPFSPASRKVSASSSTGPGSPDLAAPSSSAMLDSPESRNNSWELGGFPADVPLQEEGSQDTSRSQSPLVPDNAVPGSGQHSEASSTPHSHEEHSEDSSDTSSDTDVAPQCYASQMRYTIEAGLDHEEQCFQSNDEMPEDDESQTVDDWADTPEGLEKEQARVKKKAKTILKLENIISIPERGRGRLSKHQFKTHICGLARKPQKNTICFIISLAQEDGSLGFTDGDMQPLEALEHISSNLNESTERFLLVLDACHSGTWIEAAETLNLRKFILQVACGATKDDKSHAGLFSTKLFQAQIPNKDQVVLGQLQEDNHRHWNGDLPDFWMSSDITGEERQTGVAALGTLKVTLLSYKGNAAPNPTAPLQVPWYSCAEAMIDDHALEADDEGEPQGGDEREIWFYECARLVQAKNGAEDYFWELVQEAGADESRSKDEVIEVLVQSLDKNLELQFNGEELEELKQKLGEALWANGLPIWEEPLHNFESLKKKAGAVHWLIIRKNTLGRRKGILKCVLVMWFKSISQLRCQGQKRLIYEAVMKALQDYRDVVAALKGEHHIHPDVEVVRKEDLPHDILQAFDEYLAPIFEALFSIEPELGPDLREALREHWALTQDPFVQKFRDATAPDSASFPNLPILEAADAAPSCSEPLQESYSPQLVAAAQRSLVAAESGLEALEEEIKKRCRENVDEQVYMKRLYRLWEAKAAEAAASPRPQWLPFIQGPLRKRNLVVLCPAEPASCCSTSSMHSLPSTAETGGTDSRRPSNLSLESGVTSWSEYQQQQAQEQQQQQQQQQLQEQPQEQQLEDAMQPADTSPRNRSPTQARGSCCKELAQLFFMRRPQPAVLPPSHRPLLPDQQQ